MDCRVPPSCSRPSSRIETHYGVYPSPSVCLPNVVVVHGSLLFRESTMISFYARRRVIGPKSKVTVPTWVAASRSARRMEETANYNSVCLTAATHRVGRTGVRASARATSEISRMTIRLVFPSREHSVRRRKRRGFARRESRQNGVFPTTENITANARERWKHRVHTSRTRNDPNVVRLGTNYALIIVVFRTGVLRQLSADSIVGCSEVSRVFLRYGIRFFVLVTFLLGFQWKLNKLYDTPVRQISVYYKSSSRTCTRNLISSLIQKKFRFTKRLGRFSPN